MKKILGFICILFLISCYSENEEDLFGNDSLDMISDSVEVKFKKDIEPIFRQSCSTTPGCHVPRGTGNGVLLTYTDIKRIVDNGKLKDRVIDKKDMPQSPTPPLSNQKIALIQTWINRGAPNN